MYIFCEVVLCNCAVILENFDCRNCMKSKEIVTELFNNKYHLKPLLVQLRCKAVVQVNAFQCQ